LGISERFTVKLHKVKYELNASILALSAQFFIYRVTNWAFLTVNGLRCFSNSVIPFSKSLKDLVFLGQQKRVENRLVFWWVLALAFVLSDPTMCQPVCKSNIILC
jgi:hypothetical protein